MGTMISRRRKDGREGHAAIIRTKRDTLSSTWILRRFLPGERIYATGSLNREMQAVSRPAPAWKNPRGGDGGPRAYEKLVAEAVPGHGGGVGRIALEHRRRQGLDSVFDRFETVVDETAKIEPVAEPVVVSLASLRDGWL